MSDNTLFQFEQTMSRGDVAAYLREVADKLDAGGDLDFTAGGQSTSVRVPERVEFAVDVERDPGTNGSAEMEVEFELEWYEDEESTASGSLEIE